MLLALKTFPPGGTWWHLVALEGSSFSPACCHLVIFLTQVLLAPVTGRRHQLRLHCHRLGHTIVGDFTYSGKRWVCKKSGIIWFCRLETNHSCTSRDVLPPRMYLHAHRLLLPTALEELDINAGDPFDSSEDAAWQAGDVVCTIAQAYLDIHNEALSWHKLDLKPPVS